MEISRIDSSIFSQQTQQDLEKTAASSVGHHHPLYTQAAANCLGTLINC